jgi:hypothetical protein
MELLQDSIIELRKVPIDLNATLSTIIEQSNHNLTLHRIDEQNEKELDGWNIESLSDLQSETKESPSAGNGNEQGKVPSLPSSVCTNDNPSDNMHAIDEPIPEGTFKSTRMSIISTPSRGNKKTFQSFVKQCKLSNEIPMFYGTVEFRLCTNDGKPYLYYNLPNGKMLKSYSPSGILQLYEQHVNNRNIGINGWNRLKMKLNDEEFHSIGWNHWDQYVWNEDQKEFYCV